MKTRLDIRCEPEDKDDWMASAKREGRTLSSFVVWALNRAAKKSKRQVERDTQ